MGTPDHHRNGEGEIVHQMLGQEREKQYLHDSCCHGNVQAPLHLGLMLHLSLREGGELSTEGGEGTLSRVGTDHC